MPKRLCNGKTDGWTNGRMLARSLARSLARTHARVHDQPRREERQRSQVANERQCEREGRRERQREAAVSKLPSPCLTFLRCATEGEAWGTQQNQRERERAGERESDREGGTKGGREALEKLLSPPVIYLPVVCAGGLGKDEEWRRRRTRTGVSAVWSLDSTFCNMFC